MKSARTIPAARAALAALFACALAGCGMDLPLGPQAEPDLPGESEAVLDLSAPEESRPAAAIAPPQVEIADFGEHHLFTNGLDLAGAGVEATLDPQQSDVWTVKLKNTGNRNWLGFYVGFQCNAMINGLTMRIERVTAEAGFGAPPAIRFDRYRVGPPKTQATNPPLRAYLEPPKATAPVKPGEVVELRIEVRNAGAVLGQVYHLGVRPLAAAEH